MRLLEKICKELGVEIEEKWTANDGKRYLIGKSGTLFECEEDGFCIGTNPKNWEKILTGELKPIWKPEEGEKYFIPHFSSERSFRYDLLYWAGDEFDKWALENQIICKTKEGAINMTNKILKAIKEED